jgi:exodeoxyribonuclease VIII
MAESRPGLSFEEYAAAPGLSTSMLKLFAEAPAKARFAAEREETPAMLAGTLLHTALLEPAALEDRFDATDLDRRGTKAWAEAEEKAGNRRLVKRAEFEKALRMRDAILRHPVAAELLTGPLVVEQSLWWHDEATGLLCKGRPDGMRRDMRVLVDVKTTQSAAPHEFSRSCLKYRYHWQESRYRAGTKAAEGWEPDAFVFLAVESEGPHLAAAYELSPRDLALADEQVADMHRKWAACEAAEAAGADPVDAWPGYPNNLATLDLPSWAHA